MQVQFSPKITTVTPTYNRRNLLGRAIRSIQSQTWHVSEIIVVDDGSTDGTVDLVNDLASSDRRIRLLLRKHGGANVARNAGIAAATGDWIAFLDSDDSWEPQKIEHQVAALARKRNTVASFTGLRHVGGGKGSVYLPPHEPSLEQLRSSNVLSSTSSALVRKDVLDMVGGFDPDLPSCQDWDLWFRLRQVGPFAIVREPHLLFTSGGHERISTSYDKVFDGHKIVFERFLSGLDAKKARRVAAGHNLTLADLHMKRGAPRSAFRLAASSLLHAPTPWAVRLSLASAKRIIADKLGLPAVRPAG